MGNHATMAVADDTVQQTPCPGYRSRRQGEQRCENDTNRDLFTEARKLRMPPHVDFELQPDLLAAAGNPICPPHMGPSGVLCFCRHPEFRPKGDAVVR